MANKHLSKLSNLQKIIDESVVMRFNKEVHSTIDNLRESCRCITENLEDLSLQKSVLELDEHMRDKRIRKCIYDLEKIRNLNPSEENSDIFLTRSKRLAPVCLEILRIASARKRAEEELSVSVNDPEMNYFRGIGHLIDAVCMLRVAAEQSDQVAGDSISTAQGLLGKVAGMSSGLESDGSWNPKNAKFSIMTFPIDLHLAQEVKARDLLKRIIPPRMRVMFATSIKPDSLKRQGEWGMMFLLRFVELIYDRKARLDVIEDRVGASREGGQKASGKSPLRSAVKSCTPGDDGGRGYCRKPLWKFVYEFLVEIYGKHKMVAQRLAQLTSTLQHAFSSHARVTLFARFLSVSPLTGDDHRASVTDGKSVSASDSRSGPVVSAAGMDRAGEFGTLALNFHLEM
eukprot:223967_1